MKIISFLFYPFQFIFQRRCLLAQSKNFSFQNWFFDRINFKKIFGQIGIGNGCFICNLFYSLSIDIIQLFDHKIVKNLSWNHFRIPKTAQLRGSKIFGPGKSCLNQKSYRVYRSLKFREKMKPVLIVFGPKLANAKSSFYIHLIFVECNFLNFFSFFIKT